MVSKATTESLQTQMMEEAVNQDVNVLALVKGTERYVFFYNESTRADLFRTIARYASNPELSFTWYDAAVISQKIRHEQEEDVPVVQTPFDAE